MYQPIENQNNECDNRKIKIEYLHYGFDIRMIVQQ